MKMFGRVGMAAAALLALGLSALPASAQDKVKVGVFPISSSLPYFVAIEKGYFKELNIEPETIKLMGGPANVAAMITGQFRPGMALLTRKRQASIETTTTTFSTYLLQLRGCLA